MKLWYGAALLAMASCPTRRPPTVEEPGRPPALVYLSAADLAEEQFPELERSGLTVADLEQSRDLASFEQSWQSWGERQTLVLWSARGSARTGIQVTGEGRAGPVHSLIIRDMAELPDATQPPPRQLEALGFSGRYELYCAPAEAGLPVELRYVHLPQRRLRAGFVSQAEGSWTLDHLQFLAASSDSAALGALPLTPCSELWEAAESPGTGVIRPGR